MAVGRLQVGNVAPAINMKENLALYFAILIASIWAIITLVSLITKDYTPLAYTTPLMSIAAGFAFTRSGGSKK